MDRQQIKEELNNIFEIEPVSVAAAAVGATTGFAAARGISYLYCRNKFGKGTPEFKKCISMKSTPIGKIVQKARGKK